MLPRQALAEAGAEYAALAQRAWRWQELAQRADDSNSTNYISAAGMALYDDMEGPFAPIPAGYQVWSQEEHYAGIGLQLGSGGLVGSSPT